MEIHSSSLTFSPIGYARQFFGKNNSEQDREKINELSAIKQSLKHQFSRGVSLNGIEKTLETTRLSLALANQHKAYSLTDARTLKALEAYNQEINQPLLDQQVELITGIDIYV